MNYEEKYKEALERARALRQEAIDKEYAIDYVKDYEAIFPELAESEDERVRKRAIAILKQQRDYWSYDGPVNKFPPATQRKDLVNAIDVALSYLEKQKEEKHATIEQVYEKFLSSDTLKSAKENKYIRAQLFWELMHNGIITEVDYQYLTDDKRKLWTAEEYRIAYQKGFEMSEQLKQKEQKPVDLPAGFYVTLPDGKKYYAKEMRCNGMNVKVVEPKPVEWNANDKAFIKDCAHILDENGYEASAERLLSMFESKPVEWSEEDDKILSDLRNTLGCLMSAGAITFKTKKKFSNWLKSLRLQPKQEWSEEDENMIGRIRSVVNECASYNDALDVNGDYCEGDYAKLDAWLKSLPLNLKKKNEDVAKLCSNEWNEEDDKMLQNIIQEIEWERRNTTVDKDIRNYDRQLNFLKSLPMRCPKSSDNWKPSEVQMSMLLAVINDPNNAGAESCQLALRDLYQDLKKLM